MMVPGKNLSVDEKGGEASEKDFFMRGADGEIQPEGFEKIPLEPLAGIH